MTRRRRVTAKQIDWRTTIKVRESISEGRFAVSRHVEDKLPSLGLSRGEFLSTVSRGVVLGMKERDELSNSTDGYKHFLEGVTPKGAILEVVLKFVPAVSWPCEELLILITAYRGRA
ncbi:MAG: hypothetical protein HYY93_04230 [Planctomycetes bacterium]|nr:hypothetical protein [Planctomycetota bacterium]